MQTNTIKSILARNNLILQLCGTLSLQRSIIECSYFRQGDVHVFFF